MARLMNYAYGALPLGLALAIGLIAWQGLDAVAAVLAVGGWSLVLLGLYQIAPLLLARSAGASCSARRRATAWPS